MKIGLFTDTYPPYINGVSTSVLMLKQGLEKLGHKVYVVTVNSESFSYKKDENVLMIPGIPTGILDFRLTGLYPIKAQRIIKNWNLDIIHTHTEFGVGSFARLIAKQFNIPLVHTYHTMYEEYVYYLTKGYFDGASKRLVEYLTLFFCDKTVEELIVPTKKTHDLFKEKYKVSRDVHIIPTGIDVTRFYKENVDEKKVNILKKDLLIKNNDFIILYVGRIAKEKSIDFLIKNMKEIVKKIPSAKMIIVGDGPDMKYLTELAYEKELSKYITFTGKVPWDNVPIYYQLADVFVTASTTETQGLTVLEAMAASKPVIAINDESFRTVITNGKDGILFENDGEYQEAILKIAKDKVLKTKLSKQARITANGYSSSAYAKKVFEIYNLVLNRDTNIINKTIHGIKRILNKHGDKDEKENNM